MSQARVSWASDPHVEVSHQEALGLWRVTEDSGRVRYEHPVFGTVDDVDQVRHNLAQERSIAELLPVCPVVEDDEDVEELELETAAKCRGCGGRVKDGIARHTCPRCSCLWHEECIGEQSDAYGCPECVCKDNALAALMRLLLKARKNTQLLRSKVDGEAAESSDLLPDDDSMGEDTTSSMATSSISGDGADGAMMDTEDEDYEPEESATSSEEETPPHVRLRSSNCCAALPATRSQPPPSDEEEPPGSPWQVVAESSPGAVDRFVRYDPKTKEVELRANPDAWLDLFGLERVGFEKLPGYGFVLLNLVNENIDLLQKAIILLVAWVRKADRGADYYQTVLSLVASINHPGSRDASLGADYWAGRLLPDSMYRSIMDWKLHTHDEDYAEENRELQLEGDTDTDETEEESDADWLQERLLRLADVVEEELPVAIAYQRSEGVRRLANRLGSGAIHHEGLLTGLARLLGDVSDASAAYRNRRYRRVLTSVLAFVANSSPAMVKLDSFKRLSKMI